MNTTIQQSTTEHKEAHAWLASSGLGFIANNGGGPTFKYTAAAELLATAEGSPSHEEAERWFSRVPFVAAVKFELAHSTPHGFRHSTYTVIRPHRVRDPE